MQSAPKLKQSVVKRVSECNVANRCAGRVIRHARWSTVLKTRGRATRQDRVRGQVQTRREEVQQYARNNAVGGRSVHGNNGITWV